MGRIGFKRLCVAAFAVSLLATACGDDSGPEEDSGGTTTLDNGASSGANPTTTAAPSEAEPTVGGTLIFGGWSEPRGLDPGTLGGYGSSGGIELGAIYDRLMEWDPIAGEYVPKTAESLAPNSDATVWTLKVRPGITFSDGTPYDAAAVKFNMDRQKAGNPNVRGLLAGMTSVDVVDDLTVDFTLDAPWATFPIVLANSPGMLVSPTAFETLGEEALQTNPVGAGAGPFVVDSFIPKEELILKRNPDYFKDNVYLDGISFVYRGTGDPTYEALKSGNTDAAFFREASAISQGRDDGFDGAVYVAASGELLLLNNGIEVACKGGEPAALCSGKADGEKVATNTVTDSLTVRQAVAAAIDPEVLDERSNQGKGIPATSVFDDTFPWDPGVPLPGYDLERAKSLVEQAKGEGWDGTIRLSCGVDGPQREAQSLGIVTMLEAAGMTVDQTRAKVPVSEQVADVITKKDYDLACWGLQNTPDDAAGAQMDQFLRSSSSSNRTGYSNPAMDGVLDELKAASSTEDRRAAYKKMADLWNEGIPGVPIFHTAQGVLWGPNVNGVRGVGLSSVAFDGAWLGE